MRKLNLLLFLPVMMVVVTSCYNDSREELYKNYSNATDTTGNDGCDTVSITYSNVESILNSNCATSGCHSGTSPQSGLDLSTYNDAKRIASDGRLKTRITSSSPSEVMPPSGKLPPNEIDQLLKWAENPCPN